MSYPLAGPTQTHWLLGLIALLIGLLIVVARYRRATQPRPIPVPVRVVEHPIIGFPRTRHVELPALALPLALTIGQPWSALVGALGIAIAALLLAAFFALLLSGRISQQEELTQRAAMTPRRATDVAAAGVQPMDPARQQAFKDDIIERELVGWGDKSRWN